MKPFFVTYGKEPLLPELVELRPPWVAVSASMLKTWAIVVSSAGSAFLVDFSDAVTVESARVAFVRAYRYVESMTQQGLNRAVLPIGIWKSRPPLLLELSEVLPLEYFLDEDRETLAELVNAAEETRAKLRRAEVARDAGLLTPNGKPARA